MFAIPRPASILQVVTATGGTSATFAAQLCSPALSHFWQMQVLTHARTMLLHVASATIAAVCAATIDVSRAAIGNSIRSLP